MCHLEAYGTYVCLELSSYPNPSVRKMSWPGLKAGVAVLPHLKHAICVASRMERKDRHYKGLIESRRPSGMDGE